jgi:hypothetical protein
MTAIARKKKFRQDWIIDLSVCSKMMTDIIAIENLDHFPD